MGLVFGLSYGFDFGSRFSVLGHVTETSMH